MSDLPETPFATRLKKWLCAPLIWLGARSIDDSNDTSDYDDFMSDAELAMRQQDPRRPRVIIRTTLLVVTALIIWASFAEMDEVTHGIGKVIPSRQVQVVQSADGGVISEILVREGDIVEAGQILLKIDQTRFMSSLRENRAEYLALLARAARLSALADGAPLSMPAMVEKEDPALAARERQLYQSRLSELETQQSVARQQVSQRQQELAETRARRDQVNTLLESARQELTVTQPLYKSGAVSEVEVMRLQRDVSRLSGEREMTLAQLNRFEAAIQEANRRLEGTTLDFRNTTRKELGEVNARLKALTESEVALSDRVSQTSIKSQLKGRVKRLFINTVGGVVQPGHDILEIVPLQDVLVLETQIHPKDIGFLRPDQPALVKFTAYDFSIYGGLPGKIEQIGADTVTDEKGNAFYVVRVRTDRAQFGDKMPIIPGMVAEVDITTGRKTVMSYLLKPIYRAKQYALSER